jgi:alkane 1-monooxygenase
MCESNLTYESVCDDPGEDGMGSAAPLGAAIHGPAASPLAVARLLALHSLCFVLPLATLGFFLTAPHGRLGALAWLLVPLVSLLADWKSGAEPRQPMPAIPGWPFDGILYLLFALQVVNLALLVQMASAHGFWRMDSFVAWQMMGITSGYSGIVVAHELMHRKRAHHKAMARILMGLVLYEHFFTEHLRGHHLRVGTPEDGASARFGERYQAFFRRTVKAQFVHAWRLEAARLGDEGMRWSDPRLLRSRVVHGLVLEWGLAFGIAAVFGWGAFALWIGQAFVAVRLLECVNFFEHWGLERRGPHVAAVDSWDTTSWFTLYTLVGLSRHADHHTHSARPYPQLRHRDESPKLPGGYFAMVLLALAMPRRFEERMTAELKRRQLGPFLPQ